MREPYYADEWVTLYHGDCREVTEWLDADVLVTDPPYGIGYEGFRVVGDASPELRDEILAMWGDRPALVFGTWRAPRPTNTRQVLVWDKSYNGPGMGDLGLPWGLAHEEVYVLGQGFVGKREASVIRAMPYNSQSVDRPDHPTPKPIRLLAPLVAKCPPGIVADPFAGSGSTLLAAHDLGRPAIGVELDEHYCEIAARRLSQDVLDFGEGA
jgi:site-specific DNA-methyltransferase (adenine-specific)